MMQAPNQLRRALQTNIEPGVRAQMTDVSGACARLRRKQRRQFDSLKTNPPHARAMTASSALYARKSRSNP
jgi:hypothetical protein